MNKREKVKSVMILIGGIMGIPTWGVIFQWPGVLVQLSGVAILTYFGLIFDTDVEP